MKKKITFWSKISSTARIRKTTPPLTVLLSADRSVTQHQTVLASHLLNSCYVTLLKNGSQNPDYFPSLCDGPDSSGISSVSNSKSNPQFIVLKNQFLRIAGFMMLDWPLILWRRWCVIKWTYSAFYYMLVNTFKNTLDWPKLFF